MSKEKNKNKKEQKEPQYRWQAYLNIYLPFRVELKKSDIQEANCKFNIIKTKLPNKTIKNVLYSQIGRYNLYDYNSKNRDAEVQTFVNKYMEKADNLIKEKKDDIRRNPQVQHFIKSDVLSIDLSIYNDTKSFEYKKIGFLKMLVGLEFDKQASDADKIEGIGYAYDIISRNIKNKKDEEEIDINGKVKNKEEKEKFNIGFDYKKISEYLEKLRIAFPAESGKIYNPLINKNNSDDWAFNYDEKDKRGYTFAYIIKDEDINTYKKDKQREKMYKLSRIHEHGLKRTYNKDNNVTTLYTDDTSAMWAISRVGLGAMCIQETEEEKNRNIDVLNCDFSFMFEYCLHQKFFYYLLTQYDSLSINKSIFNRGAAKRYSLKKEEINYFTENFCKEIFSEFETQDIYELIREKIEIKEIMHDAEKSLESLEISITKNRNRVFLVVSAFASVLGIPVVFNQYLKSIAEMAIPISVPVRYILSFVIGIVVFIINLIAGRVK